MRGGLLFPWPDDEYDRGTTPDIFEVAVPKPAHCCVLFLFPALLVCGFGVTAADEVRFNRDIRPVLSTSCVKCHGPDEEHRGADLRLDTEEGVKYAFAGGLEESEAWSRITSDDEDVVMPPPDSHVDLKPEQVTLLKGWIEAGAAYEGHWSFIPPESPTVPVADGPDSGWIRNPIDAFVLKALRAKGLHPNQDADRERLLRRVTLDLTGLPPTLDEIDAFMADEADDAYERVVDRLLASRHFGERMAVVWMDAARYGDTSVFHADGPRDMWAWRDWVIDSYNSNKPFSQFTVEQLAGDLLPESDVSQQVATGFLRNNATTDEGGLIEEEYRVEYAIDRVKTTSMVWLGLSMECAQCHNHKYDPITQEEYYQFFAYFNQAADRGRQTRNGNEAPVVDVYANGNLAKADELTEKRALITAEMAQRRVASENEFGNWLAKAEANPGAIRAMPTDHVLHVALDEEKGRAVVADGTGDVGGQLKGAVKWVPGRLNNAFECDGSNFIDFGGAGDFDGSHGFSYGCWVKPSGAGNGAPIARMNNSNSYRGYDLLLSNGIVQPHIVSRWPDDAIKVRSKQRLKPNEWQHVFVTYDGSGAASGVRLYVDGKNWEWEIEQDGLSGSVASRGPFYVGRRNGGSNYKGQVDDVRVFNRVLAESEVGALAESDVVAPLLTMAAEQRTDEQIRILKDHFLTTEDKSYQSLAARQAELSSKITDLRKPVVNVMVMQDVPQMRDTYVLNRGSYDAPMKDRPVQPGIPRVLPALPEGASANRLGLAKWLIDRRNPLTARVTVNRYWSMLFGEGIVRSLEDFGAQGEWPTHPELLDWLAVDFVDSGWDIKHAIRQLVLSSTYRQSSRLTEDKRAQDPENRLLSRGARFRLQAEFVRDNALAASGLLIDTIGGPGVKPYQPPGLWNEVSLNGGLRFVQDHGQKLYRRSMYTYWKRSSPAPSMTIFDAPTREKCSLRRGRTNTPLQALVTMNDPQFVEAARVLAELSLKQNAMTLEERLEFAYRRATGVRPRNSIRNILEEAYHEELERFQADEQAAKDLLAIGESKRDETLDLSQHAALTVVASMILNLDETLTRG